jgi:hypothetical protein
MADGFRVDVTALQKAAVGVADAIEAVSSHKVSDIDCDKSTFGHDHLAATVSDFCDRGRSAWSTSPRTGARLPTG